MGLRVAVGRLLARRFLAVTPGFTIGKFRALRRTVRVLDPTVYEPVFEGLAAAGIPVEEVSVGSTPTARGSTSSSRARGCSRCCRRSRSAHT